MLVAADGGALLRGGLRIPRVDLDDPAEAVDLVGLLGDVEAGVDGLPETLGAFLGDSVALVCRDFLFGGGLGRVGEVLVEVLFAREPGAPRGEATGAVVEGALDHAALGVLGGLDPVGASDRTGQLEGGVAGVTLVELVIDDRGETTGALLLLHCDDGQAVGSERNVDLVGVGRGRVEVGEHDVFVGVLVVHHHEFVLVVDREEAEEVTVVTELLLLGLGGLVQRIEVRSRREELVAPAHDDVLLEALGDDDGVGTRRCDRLELEASLRGRERLLAGAVGVDGAESGGCADDGGGAQEAATGDGGLDDVAEVLVVGLVRHLMEASVVALHLAGEGRAVAVHRRGEERKQGADTHGSMAFHWRRRTRPCFRWKVPDGCNLGEQ